LSASGSLNTISLFEAGVAILRNFAAIMAPIFLLSAGLQYNDPDPLRWIAIYAVAGGVCLLAWLDKPVRAFAVIVGLGALAWALPLAYGVLDAVAVADLTLSMSDERPEIEEAREAVGLLIIAFAMGVIAVWPRRPDLRTALGYSDSN
jgi:hypothetical protein